MTIDDVVEDMETYKAELEAEIAALEKRINTLKEKQ
jgi:polyhydroxyalkanoate synthesis regulator phasin